MNIDEKTAVDPFSSINFEEITGANREKGEEEPTQLANNINEIKKAAELSNFNSRQASSKTKQKPINRSFSLFKEEVDIINVAMKAHSEMLEEEYGPSSKSDAVRAGLHLLATKSPKEQAELLAKHKGRGRD